MLVTSCLTFADSANHRFFLSFLNIKFNHILNEVRPGSCCIGLVMILLVNKRPKTVRCRSDQLFSITFLLTPCVTWNDGSVHWKPSVCSWVCLFSWLEMSRGGGEAGVWGGGWLISVHCCCCLCCVSDVVGVEAAVEKLCWRLDPPPLTGDSCSCAVISAFFSSYKDSNSLTLGRSACVQPCVQDYRGRWMCMAELLGRAARI